MRFRFLKFDSSVADLPSSVIAVHGLGGHREDSWTHPKTKAMWLRDFLPKNVPDARIFTFGYDSAPIGLSGSASSLFLREHANRLLHDLLNVRQGTMRQVIS